MLMIITVSDAESIHFDVKSSSLLVFHKIAHRHTFKILFNEADDIDEGNSSNGFNMDNNRTHRCD
jgi:hypothetical protein